MKTLIVILLTLFMNPSVANEPHSLYENSGGYEKAGGYERSSGYEKSRGGYQSSSTDVGYGKSLGYEKSEEGYKPYVVEERERTNRLSDERYFEQLKKARLKRSQWIAERHKTEGGAERMRTETLGGGGNNNLNQ